MRSDDDLSGFPPELPASFFPCMNIPTSLPPHDIIMYVRRELSVKMKDMDVCESLS